MRYTFIKQHDATDCAAACMGMVCLHYKKETTSYANKVWDKIVKESTAVFDETVDILKPEIIIFTSKSAWDAYKGKYKNAPNIINTVHPGRPWWHKPGGKEKLIEKWTAICNE